jgi:hypothetical protein
MTREESHHFEFVSAGASTLDRTILTIRPPKYRQSILNHK